MYMTMFVIANLPELLKPRLQDANKILAQSAIAIAEQLAVALGKKYARPHAVFFVPILVGCLADSNPKSRHAASRCLIVWARECAGGAPPSAPPQAQAEGGEHVIERGAGAGLPLILEGSGDAIAEVSILVHSRVHTL